MDCKEVYEEGIRMQAVLDYVKMNDSTFEASCGLARATVWKARRGTLTRETALRICRKYPELSIAWLIAGEGQMLREDNAGSNADLVAAINKLTEAVTALAAKIR